jgi:streptogramin lyase
LLSAITEFPLPTAGLNPSHLTVGPDGNLWFSEGWPDGSSPGAIDRITTAGAITQFPLPASDGSPSSLTVGPDGSLWFTDGAGIGRITPAGTITQFQGAGSDLTMGPDGNLWFTDGAGIGRITPAGTITAFPLPDGVGAPSGLTVGPLTVGADGNLWFTEFSLVDIRSYQPPGKIDRITPAGTITEFPLPAGVPGDLTVGPDGNVWFISGGDYSTFGFFGYGIDRITPSGAITEFALPGKHTSYFASSDLTAGPDGNFWFTENLPTGLGLSIVAGIGRITPSGASTRFPLRTRRDYFNGALTAGADGNLWFTSEFANNTRVIMRITPAGAITEFPLSTGYDLPSSFTVGPDGNLWFIDVHGIGRLDTTPPRVTNVVADAHPGKAITSILLGFNQALDPRAAARVGFYSVTSGMERGHRFVSSKGVKIAQVTYDSAAQAVRLKLAVPQKGPVRVTVRAGLGAADGITSSSDYTAVVT